MLRKQPSGSYRASLNEKLGWVTIAYATSRSLKSLLGQLDCYRSMLVTIQLQIHQVKILSWCKKIVLRCCSGRYRWTSLVKQLTIVGNWREWALLHLTALASGKMWKMNYWTFVFLEKTLCKCIPIVVLSHGNHLTRQYVNCVVL